MYVSRFRENRPFCREPCRDNGVAQCSPNYGCSSQNTLFPDSSSPSCPFSLALFSSLSYHLSRSLSFFLVFSLSLFRSGLVLRFGNRDRPSTATVHRVTANCSCIFGYRRSPICGFSLFTTDTKGRPARESARAERASLSPPSCRPVFYCRPNRDPRVLAYFRHPRARSPLSLAEQASLVLPLCRLRHKARLSPRVAAADEITFATLSAKPISVRATAYRDFSP